MIDFSQYKFGEVVKEEKRTVSKLKSTVFLVISFIMLVLAFGELVLFLIVGFPKDLILVLLIVNGVLAIGCLVMMILSGSVTKFHKSQGEDYSRSKAASAIYLLSFILFLSMTAIFVGRFVSKAFLDVLFK